MAVFSVEQACPYQDCDDLDQTAQHLMIYENQELIAYLRIFESLEKYQGNAAIGRVCSLPSKRGLGLGKTLMHQAVDFIDQNYNKAIQISAQSYLQDFYQYFGFVANTKVYLEDGIEHIGMIREQRGSNNGL